MGKRIGVNKFCTSMFDIFILRNAHFYHFCPKVGGGGWVIELEGGGQMATPVKNVALQKIALLVQHA